MPKPFSDSYYPGRRTASNASPAVPVESYSQPAPAATDAQATNYPAAQPSPAAPGFLGQIPGQVYCPVSRDPYKFAYDTYPVINAPGDVPISRSAAPYYMPQDPYNRVVEGNNASPVDPREATNQTASTGTTGQSRVSYDGAHG